MDKLKHLKLLLYKSYIIRKRYWKQSLIVQIILPLLLFLLIQYMRSVIAKEPTVYKNVTFYEKENQTKLNRESFVLNYNKFKIYYTPKNHEIDNLMKNVKNCLNLNESLTCK